MNVAVLASGGLDACGRGYPRPQLRRDEWISLNGQWEFAIDATGEWQHPADVSWSDTIVVPFAPEADKSGIGRTDFCLATWYRVTCTLPPTGDGERWLLHFGAVDCAATVWVNERYA